VLGVALDLPEGVEVGEDFDVKATVTNKSK